MRTYYSGKDSPFKAKAKQPVKLKRNNDRSYVYEGEGVHIKIWRHCNTKKWVTRISFTLEEVSTLRDAKLIVTKFLNHAQWWLG